MKVLLTIHKDSISQYTDEESIGKVHLLGPHEETACGLALEMYTIRNSNTAITCKTCISFLDWAKDVANKVKK